MRITLRTTSVQSFRPLPTYGIYLRMHHGGALGFDFSDDDKAELLRSAFLSLRPTKRQQRKFDRLCASIEHNR